MEELRTHTSDGESKEVIWDGESKDDESKEVIWDGESKGEESKEVIWDGESALEESLEWVSSERVGKVSCKLGQVVEAIRVGLV